MQTVLSLTVVVCSLIGPRANEKVKAPVPKPQEAPTLEGSYTLNYTALSTSFGGRFAPGGGGPAPVTQIVLRSSSATITKNEIAIGGGNSGYYYDDYGPGFGRGGISSNFAQTLTYTIDATKTPMTIDLFSVDVRNKKTKSLGIIEVVDDRITVSVAKPGADRPKNMDESEDVTVYYFKKAPPPPKTEFKIVAMTVGKEAEAEKELNRLAQEGYELVNSTNPASVDPKTHPTTVHFILKRKK